MKKTLEAVTQLANNSTFLTTYSFPNKENAEKCNRSLILIDDLTNRIGTEEENVSAVYLKTLRQNFLRYMNSNDTDIPRFLLNKRSIKQVISHLSDKEIYDSEIIKTDDISVIKKILFLLETATTSKELGKDFSISILKSYYSFYNNCSKVFISNMKKYVDKYYSEKYYLNQNEFIPNFNQYDKGEENYSDFLRNIKLNTNFISTKFFQEMWYIWCITRKPSTFTESFVKNNKDRINSEREDIRKCLLAVITCQINTLASRETIITNQILPMFGSVNPTDHSFWEITSDELKTKYFTFLDKAPKIYYKYFTKTFLEAFFLVLSSGNSIYEKERAIFWLKYIDIIEDFKIGVTDSKDHILRKRLAQLPGDTRMYMAFYKNCKIEIYRDSDPAAILMKLNNILAIEFTENGNAAYLYQKNHEEAQKLFNSDYVMSVTCFKYQFRSYGFIDRIIHNGYWQGNADWLLSRY